MNESHCCANARVGSQPAGSSSGCAVERGAMVAAVTDQLLPAQKSFVPRHHTGTAGGWGAGHSAIALGTVLMKPYQPTVRVKRWITTASSHEITSSFAL